VSEPLKERQEITNTKCLMSEVLSSKQGGKAASNIVSKFLENYSKSSGNYLTTHLLNQLVLHAGSRLDERPPNYDKSAWEISVDPALIFFVVLACLDLTIVQQGLEQEAVLGLYVADMANSFSKIGDLWGARERGLIQCPKRKYSIY
jgi:hypothetical protein